MKSQEVTQCPLCRGSGKVCAGGSRLRFENILLALFIMAWIGVGLCGVYLLVMWRLGL